MKVHGTVEFTTEEALEVVGIERKITELREEYLEEIAGVEEFMKGFRNSYAAPVGSEESKGLDDFVTSLKAFHKKMTALEDEKNLLKKDGKMPSNW
jgi:hypothetical protein